MRFTRASVFAVWAAVCAPAAAFDGAQTIFYVSIPLDRPSSQVAFGVRWQGSRDYQAIELDSRMLRFVSLGAIEPKWVLAGAVALGAAAALRSDKRAEAQAMAAAQPRACPQTCP
ncbi:MAG TPA: hypothetical protein VHG88_07995 [Burkholderiales bacterium]|nr:hypothetical protein [Burkholderiales bacterium]